VLTMSELARGRMHMIFAAALAVAVAVGLAVAAPGGEAAAATGPGVFGWGWNARGEAGTLGTRPIGVPSQLIRLTAPVRQLASDEIQTDESAALLADGTVDTWGANAYGGLGDGTTTERDYPAPALGLSGIITQIAVDDGFMLAVGSGGTVWAWGNNSSGQLGIGTTTNQTLPVHVPGLSGITQVAAGLDHALALSSDGTVWAWGANYDGELGNGTTASQTLPVH
jgi:alpha-tubulin suppressor-like RCC1 family protein